MGPGDLIRSRDVRTSRAAVVAGARSARQLARGRSGRARRIRPSGLGSGRAAGPDTGEHDVGIVPSEIVAPIVRPRISPGGSRVRSKAVAVIHSARKFGLEAGREGDRDMAGAPGARPPRAS